MLQDVGLQQPDGSGVRSETCLNAIHGPIGEGYAINTPEELGKKSLTKSTNIFILCVLYYI